MVATEARRLLADAAAVERIAASAGQLIGGRLQRDTIRRFRQTGNIMGAMTVQIDAARELLTDLMVTAHLQGHRRTRINAAKHIAAKRQTFGVFDKSLRFLTRRAAISDAELEALRFRYGREALRVVGEIQSSAERKILEAVRDAAGRGEHVREGVKAIRDGFQRAGIAPDNSFTFEAVFRTQTQMSYSAGRWNALRNDPAVDAILWGFTYSTVGDDRVRPEHAMLEGTTLPKDHPFWQTHFPPLGWACRCSAIELFEPAEIVEPLRETTIDGVTYRSDPSPGFAFNPGEVFRDGIA